MVEWEHCEKPIIEKLTSVGWQYKKGAEIFEKENEPLLTSRLIKAIKRINNVNDKEAQMALTILNTTPTSIEGARKILHYIKEGVPIKDEKGNPQQIALIDYNNIENNEFLVANQVRHMGKQLRILDALLYINGIPLVAVECKQIKRSWKIAYQQIKAYEEDLPNLFKYVQFSIAIGDRVVYFPNVPGLKNVPVYEWRGKNFDDLDNLVELLKPSSLLDALRYFIFYREDKGVITKVLPRYMQYEASNLIVERAVKYAKEEGHRDRGLIWHWQGSGKTLTMIFSAYKIKRLLGNPTIFFIVDRKELEEQLSGELKSVGLSFEVIDSINKLKKVLMHADGKRGIFVTLIHKFREEELREVREDLIRLSKRDKTIMTRKDVVVFIDEGHRTQYGDLAASMRSILKAASFFAFTGTPISKKDRDTYQVFGYPDEPYLHRYFITDSIRDGFTVKIAYQPRLENDVHLKKEELEAFLSSKLEEIPEEYREKVKTELKKRLNTIKVFLKNPKRIKLIAGDIAKHYIEHVEPFKAMVVAVDREACVFYKEALDKLLPPDYTEVVMTYNPSDPNEPGKIREYHKKLRERFSGKDDKEITEEIVNRFKYKDTPKILIVTDMLLTGFDAPILQTMYLDKPLKEHRLLQAIARTNRPYLRDGENIKAFGLIIDYVGIFKELKRALEIYDEIDIREVATDIKKIKEKLKSDIEKALSFFEEIEVKDDRENIMKAVEILFKKESWDEFQKLYRSIRYHYKLLKEDRLEFKNTFTWLTQVYYAYYAKVEGLPPEIEIKKDEFVEDALKFIHRTVDIGKITKDFPIIEIDEKFLEKITKQKPNERMFTDLLFAVRRYINVHRGPLTEDLVEQVESIVERWKHKKEEIAKLYKEILKIAQQIQEREEEKKKLNLSELEYSIVTILKRHVGDNPRLIEDTKTLLNETEDLRFPRWQEKSDIISTISREVMRFLVRKYKGEIDNVIRTRDEIMEVLKRWG
ncbi:HsdR family type I site-specific deoxyribonuclease [Thermococcus sp. MV5]|uniref:type I restriction endonuclease subunit R n=1 Tax=Thermococcus sp. MV5 TaxID=1638272 RepID=UPI001438E054|nr:HsdR family type I site-specific deoxyribonuclease [Thermococcus sp. MV5]NJE26610.1 HsdR family type I site-specific deoxyribonuclease [Thermococcus sp. MV5]